MLHQNEKLSSTLQEGSVFKAYLDEALPGGPTERTIEYKALFFKPDREED